METNLFGMPSIFSNDNTNKPSKRIFLMHPREVLNKLKWYEKNLGCALITIIHRGAPNDRRKIKGRDILSLGKGFMSVNTPEGEVEIPYHRIIKIELENKTVWERG